MMVLAQTRRGALALSGVLGSLGLAIAVAFLVFGMGGRDLGLVALYLFLSGSISIALSMAAIRLGVRSGLGIRYKMAVVGATGGVVALANVLVTSLLMFYSDHDLGLLIVLLVFALTISLLLAYMLSEAVTTSIRQLRDGALRLAPR